jgi:hypothetical protein
MAQYDENYNLILREKIRDSDREISSHKAVIRELNAESQDLTRFEVRQFRENKKKMEIYSQKIQELIETKRLTKIEMLKFQKS